MNPFSLMYVLRSDLGDGRAMHSSHSAACYFQADFDGVSGRLSGFTSADFEHDRIVGGEIIRALSKPVVVGCDPKHHRPNCWIVSFFGQRPHFFGSHAPVRWGLEEITRVGGALASQNGLPRFTRKIPYHALFGAATPQR